MARKSKTRTIDWRNFLLERRQALLSGFLALILIVLAFLALNTLTETNKASQKNTSQTQQTQKPVEQKTELKTTTQAQTSTVTSTKPTKVGYIVASGDNLWNIAIKYYNDGYKWTKIAQENNIANPDQIEKGQVLQISDTRVAANSNQTNSSQTLTVTYTVQKGDCLWTISQRFYSGNGYHWVQIRDANPGKVGLLSNGRPLITPGTVLTIPQIN